MLSPFECLCGNFILPEPASYVFFFALFNLRNLLYLIYAKAKDKPAFRAKHEAELVIYEAARSTLLAVQGEEKLPSLKSLQAEQQRLMDEQQRLYDERAKLKQEVRLIDTMKANVDDFLSPKQIGNDRVHSKEIE